MYSAPRVTAAAAVHAGIGIIPGVALDLTSHDEKVNVWDFSIPAQRKKAERLLAEQQPTLLIGSPMCTPFSNIQNLNKAKRDPSVIEDEIARGRLHLEWCCRLYRQQMQRGAYFLHEHPNLATSWQERCVKEVLVMKGVRG